MIVVMNRVPVNEGYSDDFLERFRTRKGLVDGQPGFIRNLVLKPLKGEFHVVMTFWETREEFDAWTKSEAFQQAHSRVPPPQMFRGHGELEIYEVGLDTLPAPTS
ncbi:MAG TPA: antibiotic biosynthesis monooxygenase [Candidatus Saccharimonadales bacterium]|nr:antibiotic biosynthesis monooxygenase [Candidatus Saccharimonadales bacterium]